MRIAQVCPYFYPHIGGVESHVMDISLELKRRGHDVTVVTSRHGKVPARDDVMGIPVLRSKVMLTLFRSPVTPSLTDDLEAVPADLYHTHSPPPVTSYFAARTAERTGVPLVVTYHCDLEISGPAGSLVTGLYRRTMEAFAMNQATGVVATTHTYAATSRSLWKLDPMVIPNAVDTKRFKPGVSGTAIRERYGIREAEPLVLFVGRLVRHKGIEYLLQALQQVNVRLLVVGGGDHAVRLKELASSLGLKEKAVFAGRVTESEKPEYFAACDMLVLPSVSRLEAFGIAALEAMASGKPVVVSDVPGVREVITNGVQGLLAEPMSPEDIARKIDRLLENPQERESMGLAGRRKVEESFTVEKVVEGLEDLYLQAQSTTSNV